MTVMVLVVDDEPDVETMFRQQFRREVRQGLCELEFALSGPRFAASPRSLRPGTPVHFGACSRCHRPDTDRPGRAGQLAPSGPPSAPS